VMMEYVIIGVMVAAAAVLAVTLFGRTIVEKFNVMTKGTAGDTAGAEQAAKSSRDNAAQAATDSETSRKKIATGQE